MIKTFCKKLIINVVYKFIWMISIYITYRQLKITMKNTRSISGKNGQYEMSALY